MHLERSRIVTRGSVRHVALLAVLTVWAAIISAQSPPQIHSIAADLAKQIEQSKIKGSEGSRGPRVLVLPFPYSGEIESMLGGGANRYEVADRACVVDLIGELKLPENEHLNHPVAAWLGKRCGADLFVTVGALVSKDQVRLEFALVRIKDGKVVRSLTRRLPWSGDTPSATRKARPASASSDAAAPLAKADPIEKTKKDVVVFPQCQQCANPEFTNDAVNAKGYRGGTVLLRLVVTTDGRVLAKQVARKYQGKVAFVSRNFGDSELAKRFGLTRYPVIFVDDVLIARPRDFGFFGAGENSGRYMPWRDARNHEKFRTTWYA